MRLIDADTLIKNLSYLYTKNHISVDMRAKEILTTIMEQPTAYSVDKVVEELNKLDIKAIKRYKGGTFGDYEGTDYYIKKSDAIEIVKQGGVSDDISREAKQGKWILDEFTAKYGNPYRCSCCNIEFGDTYNYCPNCGASMKEAKQMDEEDFCYCHYHNDTYEYFDCLDYMECEECPYYYADLDQESDRYDD